jgi:hypothetical protein
VPKTLIFASHQLRLEQFATIAEDLKKQAADYRKSR